MRTVLALLAAAAMVTGALLVRAQLDAPETEPQVTAPEVTDGDRPFALTCVSELGAACEAIGQAAAGEISVSVEAAGETADRLAAVTDVRAPELDGWLTLDPWPAMVADTRERGGRLPLFGEGGAPLARSPLVIVTVAERAAVLAPQCPGHGIGWRCIGDAAGSNWAEVGGEETWGPVKPGHADAARSAVGLLVFAQSTTDYFGRADLSAADLADPDYQAWVSGLARAVPSVAAGTGTPLDRLILQGASVYDFVGTTEAEAAPALARAGQRAAGLDLVVTDPTRTADVVLAAVAGERGAALSATLAELAPPALQEVGWQTEVGDLPSGNGLPPAGLMEALRALWQELV